MIGDGASTRVCKDTWVSKSSFLLPHDPQRECDQDVVIAHILLRRLTTWNRQKLDNFLDFAQNISCIIPSSLGTADAYCWLDTKLGSYMVKLGYPSLLELYSKPLPSVTNSNPLFYWNKLVLSICLTSSFPGSCIEVLRPPVRISSSKVLRQMCHSLIVVCLQMIIYLLLHSPFALQHWRMAPLQAPLDVSGILSIEGCLTSSRSLGCLPLMGLTCDFFLRDR